MATTDQIVAGLQSKTAVHTERLDGHDEQLEDNRKDIRGLRRFMYMAQGGFLVLGSSAGGASLIYFVSRLSSG